jgi:hypothetical protein
MKLAISEPHDRHDPSAPREPRGSLRQKAVAHQGKNDLTQGDFVDASVEGVQPCFVGVRKWEQWFALTEDLPAEAY